MQSSNYQILIQKVDEFIRKYYLNNLIRGTLHTVAVVVVAVISFALLEHYIFNSSVSSMSLRKGLLYSFAGLSGLALAYWVIVPLVQYLKLGKIISHTQAADIIGNHFSTVKDKLLNVLQLKQQNDQQENLLITASIDQKIQELRPVPFQAAIDLTENRKYLRFALPPLFLLLGLLLFSNIIENSASRIIQNDKEFERDALFRFKLKVENPSIVQYENYELIVDVDGEALPQEVFILMDNSRYKLEKVNNTTFKYQFTKLQKDTDFRLTANDVTSKKYTIDVLEKPSIVNFDIKVKYPSYTGRTPEVLSNVGDLTLPAGTQLEWAFQTQHTNDIQLQFGESPREAAVSSDANNYTFSKKVDKDGSYKIIVANKNLPQGDSVAYMLSVIPDMYPSISVKKFQDSLNKKIVFFAGDASDDYGIRNLNFHYEISREGKTVEQKSLPLLTAKGKQTTYEYTLDVNTLPLKPGDKLSYYFQVFDNDGANGSKSSKTELMYFESPTVEAMKAAENQNNKEIKTDIDKAINELEMLQNNIKKAQNAMLQTDEMNWQNKKELQNLIDQQKQVEQKMRQAKANFEENLKTQEEAGQKVDSATLEKQEILEKLFEEVMNDEMKKMFEDLEKMLDKMDKNQLMEKLNDIKMSDEEMKKELDRMLELFKKLEVEKELNETINQLDSLAQKQTDLSKETEKLDQKPNPSAQEQDKMKEAQDKLNKEFDKLKEDLDKTLDKNKALEEKVEMPEKDLEQKANEVKEDQKSGKENLDKKQNKDASKKQKNAGEKMKEMAKDMKSAMGKDKKQKNEENLKSLQQLLENLVGMSMEQENLAAEIDKAQTTAPNYVKLVQRQYKLKDDFRHVEDSLQALAKRVFELKSFVTEKVTDAKKSISKSLFYLEDRQKRPATVQQQTTMTTLNDLALMLAESMKKMNNDMAGEMSGDQNCEKPGNNPGGDKPGEGKPGKKGKPGKDGKMGDLRQMQEALQRQLQQMEQMMKDGKMPGGEQSKQFAQMAAKQAAIRKQLQQMKKEKQQQGKGGQELQNLIDQMDKTETELVNKRLPNDMQKRQQDIVTRLLEAENAEREREYEEKRKAEQADVVEQKMPPAMQEYLRQRQSQVDMFKTVSPSLKPYYKNLVEQYFNSLK